MKRTPFVHISLLVAFLFNSIITVPLVQAQEIVLPKPGVMVHLSPPENPAMLKGIKVNPNNPFRFEFILDKGNADNMSSPKSSIGDPGLPAGQAGLAESLDSRQKHSGMTKEQLKEASTKLIKYFLASLTIPEKDLWVNLSPYEKDRIVPESFGLTEMGRDLLAQDYMLKQVTASLIYPEDEVGKKFWKRVYEEAAKKYGTTNIPVNTFNKVWIVPEKAVVYENAKAGTAYVVESKLKVMLEADYLSMSKNTKPLSSPNALIGDPEVAQPLGSRLKHSGTTNELGSQIIREIVIPELTKEINEGKNFSQLRQVYNSLILATWYKKKISAIGGSASGGKEHILSKLYVDKNKTQGVNIDDPQEKQRIYQQYLQAFKKGVYNYIKEDLDPATHERIPRKYFSGGLDMALTATDKRTRLGLPQQGITYTTTTPIGLGGSREVVVEMRAEVNVPTTAENDAAMVTQSEYEENASWAPPTMSYAQWLAMRENVDEGNVNFNTSFLADRLSVPTTVVLKRSDMVDDQAGIDAIRRKKLVNLKFAAGTAGRMGRDVPEEKRPVRGMIPLFRVGETIQNSFDIAVAHARWAGITYANDPDAIAVEFSTSELTHARVTQFIESREYQGVTAFVKGSLPRLAPPRALLETDKDAKKDLDRIEQILQDSSDGEGDFRLSDGSISRKPDGTFAAFHAAFLDGTLYKHLKAGRSYMAMSNDTDLGFVIDPVLLTALINGGQDVLVTLVKKDTFFKIAIGQEQGKVTVRNGKIVDAELPKGITAKYEQDKLSLYELKDGQEVLIENAVIKKEFEKGGMRLNLDGKPVLIEGQGLPADFKQDQVDEFNTGQMIVSIKALFKAYGTTLEEYEKLSMDQKYEKIAALEERLPFHWEVKKIPDANAPDKVRYALQRIRPAGYITHVLNTLFVEIDRDAKETPGGYVAFKEIEDVERYGQAATNALSGRLYMNGQNNVVIGPNDFLSPGEVKDEIGRMVSVEEGDWDGDAAMLSRLFPKGGNVKKSDLRKAQKLKKFLLYAALAHVVIVPLEVYLFGRLFNRSSNVTVTDYSLPNLIKMISSKNVEERRSAVPLMARYLNDSQAYAVLMGLIHDDDSQVRLDAVRILVSMSPQKSFLQSKQIKAALLPLALDPQSEIRTLVMSLLTGDNDQEINLLIGGLQDANAEVAQQAVKGMVSVLATERPDDEYVRLESRLRPLATRSIHPAVRSLVLENLRDISDSKVITTNIKILAAALKDRDASVVESAQNSLQVISSALIGSMNDRHGQSDQFSAYEGLDADVLYYLIVYGREDAYTSTYKGLYKRLMSHLRAPGDAYNLLKTSDSLNARYFISLTALYGTLRDFLSYLNKDEQASVFKQFVTGLDQLNNEEINIQASLMLEAIHSLREDPELIKTLRDLITVEYERASQGQRDSIRLAYKTIQGVIPENGQFDEQWLDQVARQHQMDSLDRVDISRLMNTDGSVIVRHVFAFTDVDDDSYRDSVVNYSSFIDIYKKDPRWTIQTFTRKGYVVIRSKPGTGRDVVMYANIPDAAHLNGNANLDELLKNKKVAVVGLRGHNYAVDTIVGTITSDARIVMIGSCGGGTLLPDVLERAPEVFPTGTRGTGYRKDNNVFAQVLSDMLLNPNTMTFSMSTYRSEVNRIIPNNEYIIPPDAAYVYWRVNRILRLQEERAKSTKGLKGDKGNAGEQGQQGKDGAMTGTAEQKQPDQALVTDPKYGGIDFNADKINLQIQNAGEGIQFKTDPAMLEQLSNAAGFTPVIINIRPLESLPLFLGAATKEMAVT